jgi:hypothetical protein
MTSAQFWLCFARFGFTELKLGFCSELLGQSAGSKYVLLCKKKPKYYYCSESVDTSQDDRLYPLPDTHSDLSVKNTCRFLPVGSLYLLV